MQDSVRRKLTPEDKKTILDLAMQGWDVVSIARHLNVNGQAVNGLVSTARKRGALPPRSTQPEPPPQLTAEPEIFPMADPSHTPAGAPPVHAPMPAPAVAHPPISHSVPFPPSQPQVARDGGFSGGRPVVADSGGFTNPQSELRWTVERIVPPDGVLGTHYGPLSIEEVGQIYGGESTYKVTKFENGRAMEYTKRVGGTYGPPKNPKAQSPQVQRPDLASGAAPSAPASPRPFFQMGQDPMGGAGMFPQQRPFFPQYTPAPAADQSVATEALKQMGLQNQQILAQQQEARKSGPDTFMVQLLQSQQEAWNQRWEQERKRDEERRHIEEEKYERRQKEERDRGERERQSSADAHNRELARIKAESDARMAELRMSAEERERRVEQERKFLLDLEDKRISVIKQEAEINQKRLEAELERSRVEMRTLTDRTAAELQETRQATRESIQASQSEMNERLQREREQLDRMHSLREKALDREHELQRDMLSLQRENIQKDGGDQLYNMLQTVFKEASKGFEKLVDLKKIQALTPEAQAAAIQRGAIDGSIGNEGAQAPAPQPQPQPQPRQHRQPEPETVAPRPAAAVAGAKAPGQNGSGQPVAAPVAATATVEGETGGGGQRMLALFRQAMETEDGKKFFGSVMEEWALHVEVGNDPSVFTTLFLEMLRDENNAEVRKAATFLYTLMAARPWKKMYPVFKPYLPEAIVPVMESPAAEPFYEAFRAMVYAQMQGYYQHLLNAAKDPSQPGVQAQPAPAAIAPPAPAPAPAPAPVAEQPAVEEEPEPPAPAPEPPAPAPRFRTVS